MTYKISTLNNFVGASEPTFVGNTQIDGYINSRPVVLRRLENGTVMPAKGATLQTSMGLGRVLGSYDNRLLVDIVEFNEDYEFITADESDIYDASEMVSKLNGCLRRNFASTRSDYTRIHKSEITGKLSPKRQDLLDAHFPVISDTTLSMSFSPNAITGSTPIVYKEVSTPKLSPSEIAKQKRLQIAEAKRLADALLAEETIPSDVQDELDEMFGNDGEF
tara:strand:- start:225 stop:884 length:660 start_codon:yes stop_codon:yes gene_type:complete